MSSLFWTPHIPSSHLKHDKNVNVLLLLPGLVLLMLLKITGNKKHKTSHARQCDRTGKSARVPYAIWEKKNIENFANIISKFQHVQQTFSNLTYLLNSAHVGNWEMNIYTTHTHAHAYTFTHTHTLQKKKKVKHICLLKRDLLGKMVLRVRATAKRKVLNSIKFG